MSFSMRIGETINCITSNKEVMTCGGRDDLERVPPDIISPCPVDPSRKAPCGWLCAKKDEV